ncbi:MAG: iron ABC transporter permease [Chloroflexi bacterium]|nr:iron ABC transporter permease [Chloroflexota bacterium]
MEEAVPERRMGWVSHLRLVALHSRKILLVVVTLTVFYLVVPPIGVLLFSSIRSTANRLPFEATTFTINNFVRVFTSDVTYRIILNTAWYAAGTVIIGVGLAMVLAWFLERTNMPFRRTMFVLMLAQMGMPAIALSMSAILLANPSNGMFNVALRALLGLDAPGPINIYSMPGMIVVTALRFVPMIYMMISGMFSRIDPSFEEAGRTSGAGSLATVRHISLPLLGPATLAAVIYYLVIAAETFEIPAMLGIPGGIFVFSSAIYFAVHPPTGTPDYGVPSTYGVLVLGIAVVLIYIYSRYVRHGERFTTVTGRGYRPRLIDLGRWRYVPVLAMAGYFLLTAVIPILVLLWTSLAPMYSKVSLETVSLFNLDAYRRLLVYPFILSAAKNTLLITGATALITMILVTLVSWLAVRGGIRGAWVADRLTFSVLGVPGIVLALALIFVYVSLPIRIYGSIWIIVIALVTTCIPFGSRLMTAAFLQIHRELEEASATSGAGLWPTFFHVVLPLIWPSFTRGFLWVAYRSLREATISLMLYAVNNQTLGVTLWVLWVAETDRRLASAVAVPLMIISIVLTILVARKTMLREDSA